MKILFIFSYYSSLRNSIENNIWKPEGMPAVSKLFEGLNKQNIDFDVLFTSKPENNTQLKKIKNNFFNNIFYFYNLNLNNKFFLKILFPFVILKFHYFIKKLISINNYNLIYVDRSNFLIGALLSLLGFRVVLRLHGVSNFYSNYNSLKFKIYNPLNIISLLAPFKMIIASKDGSPSSFFLNFFYNVKNKRVMINGVDNISNAFLSDENKFKGFNNDFITLIFIGRLTNDKGIIEFVQTLIKLKKNKVFVNSIIVGDGILMQSVQKIVKKNNLQNIYFTGQIRHNDIYYYLDFSDIYVSLNKLGNLSNTVLEAYNSKKCIVLLDSCERTKKDISTRNLFRDNVLYIDRKNIVNSLFEQIIYLNDTVNLNRLKLKINNSKIKIPNWDTRIEKEITLLKEIK